MKSVAVGEALDRFLSAHGYDRRRSVEAVFDMWEEVVGALEAEMAQPISLEEGVLTLAVPNSTVGSEVSFSQGAYIERVNRYFGAPVVREVKIRVRKGRRPASSRRRAAKRAAARRTFDANAVELTADEIAWIEKTAASVRSERLREKVKRALTMHMKRTKWEMIVRAEGRLERRTPP